MKSYYFYTILFHDKLQTSLPQNNSHAVVSEDAAAISFAKFFFSCLPFSQDAFEDPRGIKHATFLGKCLKEFGFDFFVLSLLNISCCEIQIAFSNTGSSHRKIKVYTSSTPHTPIYCHFIYTKIISTKLR